MLCLTRKIGERVVIEIGAIKLVVEVLDRSGKQVRLGFIGPRSVIISREEALTRTPKKDKTNYENNN
jgi:carbon storage regulator CsrA